MSCWCGHGPWHHHGYPYPPPYRTGYPPPEYDEAPPVRRRPRRRAGETEELADYLRELEQEIARVRRDLEELRSSQRPGP